MYVCKYKVEQPQQTVTPPLTSTDELPVALLSDILSRVSSQSLLRYRCVCKRSREVVDDPYFRNSVHHVKEPVYLYHGIEEEQIYLLKIHEEATIRKEAKTQMIEIAQFPGLNDYRLQGACNGLLLFAPIANVGNNPELLINPLTSKILELPRAPDILRCTPVYGFELDCSTNTYKMVQINAIGYDEKTRTRTRTMAAARVYDFEQRLWRTCKALPSSREVHPHFAFASGALNWFLMSDSFLSPWTRATLSFDLDKRWSQIILDAAKWLHYSIRKSRIK